MVEKLCRNDSNMSAAVALAGFASELMVLFGSDALKLGRFAVQKQDRLLIVVSNRVSIRLQEQLKTTRVF